MEDWTMDRGRHSDRMRNDGGRATGDGGGVNGGGADSATVVQQRRTVGKGRVANYEWRSGGLVF